MNAGFNTMQTALAAARRQWAPVATARRPTLSLARKPAPQSKLAPAAPALAARKVGPPRWPPSLCEVFFFIWSIEGYRPSKRYSSIDFARAEQARLKALNPAREFHIYEARMVQEHHYRAENQTGPVET